MSQGGSPMTLPRSVELCWQKDVIERWLNTSGVPADAHAQLLEMLRDLKAEMDISAPCTTDVPEFGKRVASAR
jgi:hypothetical protein